MFTKEKYKDKVWGEVDVFTEKGESTEDGDKGELVVKQPFPSMPVKFWEMKMVKYPKLTSQNLKIFGITEIY